MLKVVATVDVLDHGTEMGAFLRRCRARLRPEDVGLTPYGTRRRVPGLRREELAQLAGVSVAYYTRLEQGQSRNASDGVLDAIARALRLDDDETAHLRNLARPLPPGRTRSRPERLRPGLADLVDSFGMPAYIVGRYGDIMAWNRMAHALLAGHVEYHAVQRPADRPNLSRMLFLDPHTRELYVDWNQRAQRSVACLRVTAGRHQGDPGLTALIGELAMRSPTFVTLWSAHHVRRCASSTERYQHPLVGPLTLNEQVLDMPDDNGQQLILLIADQNSPSQTALDLLVTVTTQRSESIRHVETASVKAKRSIAGFDSATTRNGTDVRCRR